MIPATGHAAAATVLTHAPGRRPAVLPRSGVVALLVLLAVTLPAANCAPRKIAVDHPLPHDAVPDALHSTAPMIRVLLSDDAIGLAVAVDGPGEIRQNGATLARFESLSQTRIARDRHDAKVLHIGPYRVPWQETLILPRRAGALHLYLPVDQRLERRRFDGYIALRPDSAGSQLNLINVVDLEHYLPGVLVSECFPSFHLEAFKAQAIAARTYALYEMLTIGRNRHYDVKATEASQVYKGIDGLDGDSKAVLATHATRGIVCAWQSPLGLKIFCTYYSSACGGLSQPVTNCLPMPAIPPLAGGVHCNYCQIHPPSYRWGPLRISKAEVTSRLTDRYPELGTLGTVSEIRVLESTPDGRPLRLELMGSGGQQYAINSYKFRLAMDGHRMRSNHCRIVDLGNAFEFRDGKGFGHAVGMCQWGAEGQARAGRRAAEVIAFYYPDSELVLGY